MPQPQVAGGEAQQVLRVAADVEFGIGVDSGLAKQQQAGADLLEVSSDCAVGLAVQQLAGERDPLGFGDRPANLEVGPIDLGDAGIDDLLVQLLLLLEAELPAGLLVQTAGDLVEGDVVEIGVVGGHGMDLRPQPPRQIQRRLEGPETAARPVETDDQRPVADRPVRLAHDQRVDRATPDHAIADRADRASGHGAQPDRPQHQEVIVAARRGFDNAPVVLALRTQPAIGDLGLLADRRRRIVVAV